MHVTSMLNPDIRRSAFALRRSLSSEAYSKALATSANQGRYYFCFEGDSSTSRPTLARPRPVQRSPPCRRRFRVCPGAGRVLAGCGRWQKKTTPLSGEATCLFAGLTLPGGDLIRAVMRVWTRSVTKAHE